MTSADWYPDPYDSTRWRYWDGQHWTSLVAAPQQAVWEPPISSAGEGPPKVAEVWANPAGQSGATRPIPSLDPNQMSPIPNQPGEFRKTAKRRQGLLQSIRKAAHHNETKEVAVLERDAPKTLVPNADETVPPQRPFPDPALIRSGNVCGFAVVVVFQIELCFNV